MFEKKVDEQITLRLLEPMYAQELFELTDTNRSYLRQWLPWLDSVRTVDHTRAFLETCPRQMAANNGFQAGIWYNDSVVGVIGFHSIDWANKSTSIGYWLGAEFQGRGIMTRACRALVDYALKELKLHRVEIRCAASNIKSRAIPERLGFKNEGVAREAEWLYDKYVDLVIYGMLAHEWISSAAFQTKR